ncbi:ArsR/SmtB family transcription factor [Marininema halotolerans]|uniref:Helix-turn-helix domain-containing protein n=1 Tax=Marininema halotolerans TaxID=1155944 RepID=A0A1I6RJ58_9BACL|nr:winged helix-turn-helix domain-containing protein [Marininema halotolerans]SFS64676.1 Helix-turn-helix domain-containing protein [Marininema halotolerans]
MHLLDWGMERHTYQVRWDQSLLWETVLGIAAVTYTEIHPTLETTTSYWKNSSQSFSNTLQLTLEEAKQHNLWKTLLHLVFYSQSHDVKAFLEWMQRLDPKIFRYHALPYLGEEWEDARKQAAQGDEVAVTTLVQAGKQNPMFPSYIRHMTEVEIDPLKEKLNLLVEHWYQEVIAPHASWLNEILEREIHSRESRMESLTSEQIVEELTGIAYTPEPSVYEVVLIPHIVYRPWTIQGSAQGTRIFYYPVSDESLFVKEDPYAPPSTLIRFHKALGDEKRLRILKMLQQKHRSLQELAEGMNLPKTTVHHHLRMLRSAHLVELNGNQFCIGMRGLERGGRGLQAFLEKEDVL